MPCAPCVAALFSARRSCYLSAGELLPPSRGPTRRSCRLFGNPQACRCHRYGSTIRIPHIFGTHPAQAGGPQKQVGAHPRYGAKGANGA
jgi:hypothetical protein